MKYPTKSATGDAGEFFFAYQIAKVLQWPCRLIDIDIGIDAQVEIIDDDRSSTGRFVAFQVKATENSTKLYWYVSESQIDYWRDLDLPVFVVLVDVPAEKMYLHLVDVYKSYKVTPKGGIRIDFDPTSELFTPASSAVISKAAQSAALAKVRRRLRVVQQRAKEIRAAVADQDINPDPDALIEIMDDRATFKSELAQAWTLAEELRVGQKECTSAERLLNEAIREMREYMEPWYRDHDVDGRIARFIRED